MAAVVDAVAAAIEAEGEAHRGEDATAQDWPHVGRRPEAEGRPGKLH